jgi:hypothetical protein
MMSRWKRAFMTIWWDCWFFRLNCVFAIVGGLYFFVF